MPTGQLVDPFGNYNFHVEIDGISRAAFQQVGGFDSTVESIDFRQGGDPTTRKIPGQLKYSNINLKWGITDDLTLYAWHQQAIVGNLQRRNGSIVLLDRQRQEVARWNFIRAWPTRYDAPDLDASASAIAIEAFELCHEGLTRVL